MLELGTVYLIIFLYIGFALTHHYFDKSLTSETILEYILIAMLVIVILAGVIH